MMCVGAVRTGRPRSLQLVCSRIAGIGTGAMGPGSVIAYWRRNVRQVQPEAEPAAPVAPSAVEVQKPAKPPRSQMMRQYDLVERVRSYNPNTDEDLLNQAYVYAMKAHGEQNQIETIVDLINAIFDGDARHELPLRLQGVECG